MAFATDPLHALGNPIARVKTQIENLDTGTLEQLDHAYKYRALMGILRSTGKFNILLGGLTLWLGINGWDYSTLHVFQAIFGALAVIVSIWAVVAPSLLGIRIFSGMLLIAGIWNVFLTIRDGFAGLSILVGLLGIAQLWWAYRENQRYQRYAFLEKPSAAIVQTQDEILDAIQRSSPQTDPDFVELKVDSKRWKGWLLGNLAVLGSDKLNLVYVESESKVLWIPQPANIDRKKRFTIRLQHDTFSQQGSISKASFEKYAEWKLKNNPGRSREDLSLQGTGKIGFSALPPLVRVLIIVTSFSIIFYLLLALLMRLAGG